MVQTESDLVGNTRRSDDKDSTGAHSKWKHLSDAGIDVARNDYSGLLLFSSATGSFAGMDDSPS